MVVGILKIQIYMNSVFSLKEKRQIVKSIIERTKIKFKISVAEVKQNDVWKNSVIGISIVSNEKFNVESITSKVIDFIENDGRFEVVNIEKDIFYY